ncbi:MAG: ABC transporter ATP-binding protein/permease [Planctomycetaceae bacterium]|nr:ABC transporter ATP-binding protein/permease [Planctomycetaceae bacterium]
MSNFYRAIQKTFRYQWSIAFATFCALMIGCLWGGNITIVYPFVNVTFDGGNIPDWVEQQLKEIRKQKSELLAQIVRKPDLSNENPPNTEKKRVKNSTVDNKKKLVKAFQNEMILEFLQPWINRIAPRDAFNTVAFLVMFVLIGSVLKGIFTVLHSLTVARITGLSIMELRNDLYQKVLHHDPNSYSRSGIADAMSRLTGDVGSLAVGLDILYGKMVREPLKMIACLAFAAYISWQLLLLTLLLVPVAGFLIRWIAKSIKRSVRKSLEQGVRVFARIEESLRSIRIVRSFASERFEFGKFRRTNKTAFKLGMKIAKYGVLVNPITEIMGILMISLAILAGAHLVLHTPTSLCGLPLFGQEITKGGLLVFFALLAGAADPARKLSDIFSQFNAATAAADRVYELIDRVPEVRECEHPKSLLRFRDKIEIDHVSFEYEPGREVLHDVSLTLKFGETIAIVGPSGCGKSTLLSLIPRFADPAKGELRIDGIPLRELKMRDLYHQIGLVSQEPSLFDETVYENIRYGSFFASRDEIIDAAKKANAHNFITQELSNGYDTMVGPGGSLLSGGQRQRIVLARAILRNPSLLLLDEATSQIDMASEKMIHDALLGFIGNRTTIIVTHRIGALAIADRIVVMRDGVIEHIGTHQELLESSPYYANMNRVEM